MIGFMPPTIDAKHRLTDRYQEHRAAVRDLDAYGQPVTYVGKHRRTTPDYNPHPEYLLVLPERTTPVGFGPA